MRKILLISAALTALLAGPALAQRDDDHGRGGGGERGAPPAHAAAPAPRAAPQAPPHAPPSNHAQAGRQPAQAQQPPQNRDRSAQQRNDNNRPDANRSNANRPASNPGNNGRPANASARPGNRPNWSQYHRAVNAPQRFHYRGPAYVRPAGWYSRRWNFGEILPSLFWTSNFWINDFNDYDLPPPPPGAVWVRDGADALLIDRYTGEIVEVEYGMFY